MMQVDIPVSWMRRDLDVMWEISKRWEVGRWEVGKIGSDGGVMVSVPWYS